MKKIAEEKAKAESLKKAPSSLHQAVKPTAVPVQKAPTQQPAPAKKPVTPSPIQQKPVATKATPVKAPAKPVAAAAPSKPQEQQIKIPQTIIASAKLIKEKFKTTEELFDYIEKQNPHGLM